MVRTRSGKSESSDSQLEEGFVESCDVREAIPTRGLREEDAIGSIGRGGPWCQPPGTLSSAMGVERLQFLQRVQKPGESVDDFADELRCLGAEVGKQDDDLKEQFIMGLQDTAAQRHLLDKRPDSFDQAVQIAKQYRAAQASVENMQRRRRLMVTGGCQDGYAIEGSGPSTTENQLIVTALERIEDRLSRLEVAHQRDEHRIRRKNHREGTAIREAARSKAELTCFVCATTGHVARDCPMRQRESNATEDSAMSLTDGALSRESRRLPYVEVEVSNGMSAESPCNHGSRQHLKEWMELRVNAVVLAAPPCPLALGMDALTSLGVTLELSAQGSLVQLMNDRQPTDKEILPTRAETWTAEEPITSVMAGVTYGEQLNGEGGESRGGGSWNHPSNTNTGSKSYHVSPVSRLK
ncbi:zf-CCHC domain containing protein [Trichuris trichiura]|uniref:Zf-CCHC domain containing protein n=1 Tax=Trichuris trichiura TaxID=36087 RepID=A0A077ZGJ4_TRITR|nr:zf-CCHC domain containing protein [Trichuris trichiura]